MNLSNTRKLTISAITMACYIVIMYFTAAFSFGGYQIRIATAIYALAYLFPFLVLPLGLSNLLSNMLLGGLGIFDIVGGGLIGIMTAGVCALLGKARRSAWWVVLPITLIPGFGVALWLSCLLKTPYLTQAAALCAGQLVPGLVGAAVLKAVTRLRPSLLQSQNK